MPIPVNHHATDTEPDAVAPDHASPGLARPGLSTAPALTGQRLILRRGNSLWTCMASEGELCCLHGEIVPRLAIARHEPGDNGNAPGPNRGEGAIAGLRARGYREIPHDLPGLVAFGEPVTGAGEGADYQSNYVRRYRGYTIAGVPVMYHVDRWRRPQIIGANVRWETDPVGYMAFLRACCRIVLPKIEAIHVQIATEALLDKAKRHLMYDAGAARDRVLSQIAAHLPHQYAPPGLLEFYPEPEKLESKPQKAAKA